ncbi:hypothetical protein AB7M17_005572 [Bradyrhizobium sp. USDA 377]
MDLFSLFSLANAEADRIALDTTVPATDRQAAAQVRDALKNLRGTAFRLRGYLPPVKPTPVDAT